VKIISTFGGLFALLCGIACSEQKETTPISEASPSSPSHPVLDKPASTPKLVEETPDQSQLALKILTISGGKQTSDQMINRLAATLPEEQMAQFLKKVDIDELMTALATVYSKRFNAAELQDIIDYYETPAGTSFAKKRPAMMTLAIKAGQTFTQKRMAGQPVTLPIPGEDKDDPLRNAMALMTVSGEAAATAETIDTMIESLKRTNPDAAQKLAEVMDPKDINLLAAKVMADIFSLTEMQSMIQFFETPTGKNLSKHMPSILRETGKTAEEYFKNKLLR
jgi:hypothetical protein